MSARPHRGQPLASLALVLAGWVGLRAVAWEPPFALSGLVEAPRLAGNTQAPARQAAALETFGQAVRGSVWPDAPPARSAAASWPPARPVLSPPEPALPLAFGASQPLDLADPPPPAVVAPSALPPHVAAAHQLLYLAALGRLPLPPGLALAALPPVAAPVSSTNTAAPRWSGDGWVLVRRGGQGAAAGGLAAAPGSPAYGASQAGGIVRFALTPGAARAPLAYLRVSRALGGFDEGEVAAGLSARPFAAVPVRLLGETRVQRSAGVTRVRPAAALVSELPPVRLPLGIEGEGYAQAGYAAAPFGTKRGATPFFDVQAVADRRLAGTRPAEVRLGAGAWSGGQEGAARLDLGPRASLRLDVGPARSRLAFDWRFRVAGNARPASGPALTFSAGF